MSTQLLQLPEEDQYRIAFMCIMLWFEHDVDRAKPKIIHGKTIFPSTHTFVNKARRQSEALFKGQITPLEVIDEYNRRWWLDE